jgi:DNA end-binding protein Ku
MSPRAIWSGTVSFGLVSIPVKMHSAVHEHKVGFHRLSPDGTCRLRMKLFCPETGEEYEFGEAARGYEVGPDRYVLVDDEELEALRPEGSRSIDIEDFVDLAEIDPIYYDRPYHLTPDKNGVKPYRLLAEAMERSARVAIARFVMRSREYLAVLRSVEGALLLSTMHYRDEVVLPSDAEGRPAGGVELGARELEMADRLIESMRVPFDPGAYRDEYRERLEAMLRAKAEGQTVTAPSGPERRGGEVVDLMEALKRSLGAAGARSRPAGEGGERAAPAAPRSEPAARPGPKKAEPRRKPATPTKKRAGGRR